MSRSRASVVAVAGVLLAATVAGCGGDDPGAAGDDDPTTTAAPASAPTSAGPDDCPVAPVERLVPQVERRMDHDPTAFTQGLVIDDGTLYESTGLVGRSSVIAADPDTGEVLDSAPAPEEVFAEGLTARADGTLVQLTWTEGRAFVRDPGSLEVLDEFSYEGEGWGITTLDDGALVMSDGSDRLTVRDPATFEVLDTWTVERDGGAADQLNELEWDGEHLWANRWKTDEIVRIDVDCRRVDAVVDASALTDEAATVADDDIDVLNGVAHVPGSDRYLVTGKLWPVTFDVRFVPAPADGP